MLFQEMLRNELKLECRAEDYSGEEEKERIGLRPNCKWLSVTVEGIVNSSCEQQLGVERF